jgi:SAM-dependent methyltransferase
MDSKLQSLARSYDDSYRSSNFFRYRRWMFRPFIRAVASKACLAKGSSVLDLGCGQGLFTSLFAELGMKASGVDISGEAIRCATAEYGSSGARFEVGDVRHLSYENVFGCVFVRSCSLYNSPAFEENREVTEVFLRYVEKGGVLIFDYNSRLHPEKSGTKWIDHSVATVRRHFSCYPQAKVYFSARVDTILLNRLALSSPITGLAILVNQMTGVGGEIVAFVRKQ